MREIAITVLLSGLLLAGCNQDFYADQVIKPNTTSGKVWLSLGGSGEQLVKRGKIDAHRRIATDEGIEIDTWVIRARPEPDAPAGPRRVAVLLHGLGESKASYLGLGGKLARKGFDVVLPDLRAHGRSGGQYVTYGARESEDVRKVIAQLREEKLIAAGVDPPRLFVFGVTLGASTGIQYAAGEGPCSGVMAVAPYRGAESVARRTVASMAPTMSDQDFQGVLEAMTRKADFQPAEASTVAAASRMTAPLVVVHGLMDLSVPRESVEAIYEAAGEPKKLILVKPTEFLGVAVRWEDWIVERMEELAAEPGVGAVEAGDAATRPAP